MFINQLQLKNFRNYFELNLDFNSNKVLIIGKNAQGKTNILEAISYFSTLNSLRAKAENEMIKWQENYTVIKICVEKQNMTTDLEVVLNSDKKKILKVNDIKKNKNSDFLGQLLSVNFSVNDLLLLRGTPDDRRNRLDSSINQLYPAFYERILKYNKIKTQKNNLLKDLKTTVSNDFSLLEVFNEQMCIVGSNIIFLRLKFLKDLSLIAKEKHSSISETESLKIAYNSNFLSDIFVESTDLKIDDIALQYERALKERQQEEIIRVKSLVGPHRDDISFFINNIDSKKFASQGQQRTIVLALKLAELELLTNKYGDTPVLLLDDVLAELDDLRQTFLLDSIKKQTQVIITSVDTLNFNEEFLKNVQIIKIQNGKYSKYQTIN